MQTVFLDQSSILIEFDKNFTQTMYINMLLTLCLQGVLMGKFFQAGDAQEKIPLVVALCVVRALVKIGKGCLYYALE